MRPALLLLSCLSAAFLFCGCQPDSQIRQQNPGPLDPGQPGGTLSALDLSTVTPSSGPNIGGIFLTLKGNGFTEGMQVQIGDRMATDVRAISQTQIIALLPPQPGVIGRVPIKVSRTDGSTVTRADLFACGAMTIDFQAYRAVSTTFTPSALGVADLSGDGAPDLLLAGSGQVEILTNSGSGWFGLRRAFATGGTPRGLIVGDLDGDRLPDLIVNTSSTTKGTLSILINNGVQGFGLPQITDLSGPATFLVSADFNGDKTPDLAFGTSTTDTLNLLSGDGRGRMIPGPSFSTGRQPTQAAAVDVNGDGRPDLVTVNQGSDDISLFINDAAGGFLPRVNASIAAGAKPIAIVAADLNADQMPDLVTLNSGTRTLSIFRNSGGSSFSLPTSVPISASSLSALALIDLDGDNSLDIVVRGFDGRAFLQPLLNDGSGGFRSDTRLFVEGSQGELLVSDVNNDRKPDLVSLSSAPQVAILLGNGQGSFKAAKQHLIAPVPATVSSMVAADVNKDGKPDFIIPNGTDLFVALNQGQGNFLTVANNGVSRAMASPAVGDWNADGLPDVAVVNSTDQVVDVLSGDGTGRFSLLKRITFSSSSDRPSAIAVGNLSGGGFDDLIIVLNNSSINYLVLIPSYGSRGFGPLQQIYSQPSYSINELAVADFNRDSQVDIFYSSRENAIIYGNGLGSFAPPRPLMTNDQSTNYLPMTINDFDQDGYLDLVTPGRLWLNNRVGDFTPFPANMNIAASGYLTSGDLNGDALPDLAQTGSSPTGEYYVSNLLNTGTGSLEGLYRFIAPTGSIASARGIWVGDCTGDQKSDMVLLSTSSSSGLMLNLLINQSY